MSKYRWTHNSPLRRSHVGERIEKGDIFEPTENEQTAFFNHMEKVEVESKSVEDEDSGSEDYAEMSYDKLRQLAADADTDAINGRSAKEDIIAYFKE